ncbi:MAG: 16S rRNA (guanine(966)-N(2))-methyltransferase RsmD [Acidobacteria bacterium]|nr:16S rRNA (guanine(966)-N(2))-methyltransferase RsmD [Acidobacteriota bacterium]
MRIIAGKYKGRRIFLPAKPGFRPTSDRARETLFNILSSTIEGAVFADCFAGSGSVGIEAISRGASEVLAVENNPANIKLIKHNFEQIGCLDNLTLYKSDFVRIFQKIVSDKQDIDIIFCDPPYYQGHYESISRLLDKSNEFIKAVVIIEHPTRSPVPLPDSFKLERVSKIGDTSFSFLKKK